MTVSIELDSEDESELSFDQLYGPDLFRRDHTGEELRQMALLDPDLKRHEELMILAFAFDRDTESIAEIQQGRGIQWASIIKQSDRLKARYKSGGLARVLQPYLKLVPIEKLRKYREMILHTAEARAILSRYLSARLAYIRTGERLRQLRSQKRHVSTAIKDLKRGE